MMGRGVVHPLGELFLSWRHNRMFSSFCLVWCSIYYVFFLNQTHLWLPALDIFTPTTPTNALDRVFLTIWSIAAWGGMYGRVRGVPIDYERYSTGGKGEPWSIAQFFCWVGRFPTPLGRSLWCSVWTVGG